MLSGLCLGARYRPSDGCLFPLKLAHALAREAVRMGCEVRTWTKAEQIVLQGGRVAGVRTAGGLLEAEVVVNAANGWAAYLTPELPIIPLRSLAVITEPAPPVPALTFEAELDSKIIYGCTQTKRGNLLVGGPPEFTTTREGQFNEGGLSAGDAGERVRDTEDVSQARLPERHPGLVGGHGHHSRTACPASGQ